ncbi:MAG: AMP-binding enzyme [Bordetella sp.]|uniref:AMP-binding enzyme n=1 Tax=Bordetella sp. TaxID=28081 RepID=UPI003F7B9FD9
MRGHSNDNPAWWEQTGVLHRVICDLIHAELTSLRRRAPVVPLPWQESTHLALDLEVDSLEMLTLASRLSEMLHIHRAGIEDYLLAKLHLQDWTSVALTSLRRFSADLTFHTSGSSGAPKPCTHSCDWLWQEVATLQTLFAGRRRILSAVSSHHIYGFLFTVLLPQALGLQAGETLDLRASSPASLTNILRPGDLVVAHPDYWRAAQRSGCTVPADVIGVSSGGPCDEALARALRTWGLAQLFQIFGSSETGGIGWRTDETEPYTCFPYWRVQEDACAIVRCLPDGASACFALQDSLTWVDEYRFFPQGRRDQVVQVGGVNVFPGCVAEALKQHPAVLDAQVRLMRPDEGNRLKAYVVPQDERADREALAQTLATWVRDHFLPVERPAAFTFGSALPRQSNGKPSDWII